MQARAGFETCCYIVDLVFVALSAQWLDGQANEDYNLCGPSAVLFHTVLIIPAIVVAVIFVPAAMPAVIVRSSF
jgi:hypothetical protein